MRTRSSTVVISALVAATAAVIGAPIIPSAGASETASITDRLYIEATTPDGAGPFPIVVLVPGGRSDSTLFTDKHVPEQLAALGYLTVVFDPAGRGSSSGTEDDGGAAHQADLADIVGYAKTLTDADPTRIALATNSYGVTMAAGALVDYPSMDVDALIDWEGPADRNDTGGCDGVHLGGHLYGVYDCSDEAAWSEREAITFIGLITQDYVRLQSTTDHVQPDTDSAAAMVNAALAGPAASVRLNRTAITRPLTTPIAPRLLLPDRLDRQLPQLIDQALTTLGF